MIENDFERFRKLVLADDSLQRALRDLGDPNVFIDRVVELGMKENCVFTHADVKEAMRASRHAWIEGTK